MDVCKLPDVQRLELLFCVNVQYNKVMINQQNDKEGFQANIPISYNVGAGKEVNNLKKLPSFNSLRVFTVLSSVFVLLLTAVFLFINPSYTSSRDILQILSIFAMLFIVGDARYLNILMEEKYQNLGKYKYILWTLVILLLLNIYLIYIFFITFAPTIFKWSGGL